MHSSQELIFWSWKSRKSGKSRKILMPVEYNNRFWWTKVDIPLYESVTDVKLNALEIDVESLPPTVMIQRINSILYESSIEAEPPMQKKKYKWTANLKPLVKESVDLHRKLRKTPPGEAYDRMKEALKLTKQRIRRIKNRQPQREEQIFIKRL